MTEQTVGFIGLGLMGKPMAKNLRKRGFQVIVHSRSAPPVEELVAAGARRAESPADVAREARYIITMLPTRRTLRRSSQALAVSSKRSSQELCS